MLARLPAADHSTAIFALVYALALATLVRLARDLVALNDPFVRVFEGGRDVTKDLFFSGHVATACLFVLLWRGSRARPIVAAAPVFAWLAFRAGERLA